ncbi:hypothetical protein F477_03612 [Pseudomonas sp. URIL14HWK12:I3]|nr:hypothetical protein F478_02561 [Pseudomonas sp. URIL14HWK12:I2]PZW53511.1 hypothetical protein F477_03612 [Pseudomonas sp. URIL14HWK12:I3]
MQPEFQVREVTRYIITRYDGKTIKTVVECQSLAAANELKNALVQQAESMSHSQPPDDFDLYHANLGLSYNSLANNDVRTFGQLRVMSKKQLRALKGMGPTRLTPILDYLARHGIHL